jgi:hypothetical protein
MSGGQVVGGLVGAVAGFLIGGPTGAHLWRAARVVGGRIC